MKTRAKSNGNICGRKTVWQTILVVMYSIFHTVYTCADKPSVEKSSFAN